MPQNPRTEGLKPLSPAAMVEELRDQAREAADDLNEEMPETAFKLGLAQKWHPEDMLEWWAADMIEELDSKLQAVNPRETSKDRGHQE